MNAASFQSQHSLDKMSYRRNLFNGRYALRFESEKLDFLPLLPEELQTMILSHLNVFQLRQCMLVSRKWNAMINCDHIWKRLCLSLGFKPDDDQNLPDNPKSTFCNWARIFWRYRSSPSFGWRFRIWKNIHFREGTVFSKIVSDGKSVVCCFKSSFWLMRSAKLTSRKYIQKLPLSIDSDCSVAVDNDYIAITKCNILLVYKWTESRFKFILAMSILNNAKTNLHSTLGRFLKVQLKENAPPVNILTFCKGAIWLQEQHLKSTIVLNINTQKIARRLQFTYTYIDRHITKWYIASWSSQNLRVDTFLGNNIFKKRKQVYNVRGNKNVLVVFSYSTFLRSQRVETYDLCTGKKLFRLSRPRPSFASYELHSSQNILYEKVFRNSKIKARDAVTGEKVWTREMHSKYSDSDWCLKVVCEKYLVLCTRYVSSLRTSIPPLLVYDALTGKHLYHACAPIGRLELLSDHLIICKNEVDNVVNVRSMVALP